MQTIIASNTFPQTVAPPFFKMLNNFYSDNFKFSAIYSVNAIILVINMKIDRQSNGFNGLNSNLITFPNYKYNK